ncbi:MAG: LuxR C-terminal-related transcriptional regulator [Actinomycetota bacterium]
MLTTTTTGRRNRANNEEGFERILLIEDHALFADSIKAAIRKRSGVEAAHAQSITDAREMIDDFDPELILIDLSLPDGSGVDYGREISASDPTKIVVAVSGTDDTSAPDRVRRAGFHGFLRKGSSLDDFLDALGRLSRGTKVFASPGSWGPRTAPTNEQKHAEFMAAQLTSREIDVLEMLVAGSASEEISRGLAISTNTVRSHIQSILCKLQVHSRLEAAAFAVKYGVVPTRHAHLERRRGA